MMPDKLQITRNWLPRYTGMPLEKFGEHILLTNFQNYVRMFAEQRRPLNAGRHQR